MLGFSKETDEDAKPSGVLSNIRKGSRTTTDRNGNAQACGQFVPSLLRSKRYFLPANARGYQVVRKGIMQYYTYLEDVTVDSLRIDASPRDGMAVSQICFYAVLTGESGKTYNIMRALPMPKKYTSMNFGFYRGTDALDEPGELVFSFDEVPPVEPYWTESAHNAVVYAGNSFRYELDDKGYHWVDAKGQIDVRAERLGQAFVFYVPQQQLFPSPIMLRDHICKMTGTIGGEQVEGVFHDSHIYARPDTDFPDTYLNSRLENFWADWLVEYDDGTLEAGFVMKGHPVANYTIAFQYIDGTSYARSDATFDIDRNEKGTMSRVRVAIGQDLEMIMDQHGSFDRPLHTYGTVSSTTRPKKVAKSWNYTENWPQNWGELEAYQAAYRALFGQFPSLRAMLEKAEIVNEKLKFN